MSNNPHENVLSTPSELTQASQNRHQQRVGRIKSSKNHAIRKAAHRLFITKDYESITMDEVAATAQVSKATLYKHFETKELLYRTTIDALFAALEQKRSFVAATLEEHLKLYLKYCLEEEITQFMRHCASQILRFPELSARLWNNEYKEVSRILVHYNTMLKEDIPEHETSKAWVRSMFAFLHSELVYPVWYGGQTKTSEDHINQVIDSAIKLLDRENLPTKEEQTPPDHYHRTLDRVVFF